MSIFVTTNCFIMAYKEYSFVDVSTLSDSEKETWQMKNVILKCIGGLPENVRNIRIAEIINFKSEDKSTDGCFRPVEEDIIIARYILQRPEAFLGVLCHELAHAKSGASDGTKDFELELTHMLGYLAYSLVKLSDNDEKKVSESRSLDSYTFAYVGCKCMDCFEERFDWNDDKSYVRCKVCGREYLGGYNELVDLNRKYIENNGASMHKKDIFSAIKKMLSKQ